MNWRINKMIRCYRLMILSIVFFSLIFCSSCVSWYSFGNIRYDTKEEALKAQKKYLSEINEKFTPMNAPEYGSALVVIPTQNASATRGIRGVDPRQISKASLDYLVETSTTHNQFTAKLLKNWNLFENTVIEEALYPGELAYEKRNLYDAVVYIKHPGSGKIGLYLVTPHSIEETILFPENTIPNNEAGYRFFLNNIKKAMKTENVNFTPGKPDIVKLEKSMKNERPSDTKTDEKVEGTGEEGEKHVSANPNSINNLIMIDPFAYDNMNNDSLGHNLTIAILNFPDVRKDFKENDTLIGTLYGAVYHNPLQRVHSKQPINLDIMNVMETLFFANGFQVKRYPNISNPSQLPDERLVIKGKVNKLWVKIFHSIEADVDIDVEIFDKKLKKNVWIGKIQHSQEEDPSKTVGMVPFLNEVLQKAVYNAWIEQGMKKALVTFGKQYAKEKPEIKTQKKVTKVKSAPKEYKVASIPQKPSYTRPSSSSNEIERDGVYVAYANGIVWDMDTGLEWFAGPDKDMNWDEARSWVQSLNLDDSGWRMPTMYELRGLYKKGEGKWNMTPLLKTTGWYVWSEEKEDSLSALPYFFDFENKRWHNRYDYYSLRAFAVRSRSEKVDVVSLPQKPSYSRSSSTSDVIERDGVYVAYANGIVKNTKTGLEWKVGPDKDTTWNEARSWVQNLNLDGGGWRMPTMDELEGLYKKGASKWNMTPMLKTTGLRVWSGETDLSRAGIFFYLKYGFRDWINCDISNGTRAFAVRFKGIEKVIKVWGKEDKTDPITTVEEKKKSPIITPKVEKTETPSPEEGKAPFSERLRKLKAMKELGLVSEEEYERERAKIEGK